MSECAAAVCLENRQMADGRTCVDRCALGGDPTSLTGADPHGQTLRYLLKQVITNDAISLVHAHGTGTPLNDPIELAAIEDCLPTEGQPSHVYSHKGALGHSLGAAGLVAVVLSDEMHRREVVLPNVQTHDPLPAGRVILAREPVRRTIRSSLCVASGFGGPSAAVRLIS
jgi:3-oxoacyl-[acyl-carrier-protein] synthase II